MTELRARLSELIDRAAAGETVRVPVRGRPRAVLGPILGSSGLDLGLAAGWITQASEELPRHVARQQTSLGIADAIAEDRGI